jgi:hypothetical protein
MQRIIALIGVALFGLTACAAQDRPGSIVTPSTLSSDGVIRPAANEDGWGGG